MSYKKRICIITSIALVFVLSVMLLFRWSSGSIYSLEIDADKIHHISWSSLDVGQSEITDRDEIEAIVSYLNAWSLIEYRRIAWWDGVDTYPPLRIWFFDEEGNSTGDWIVCRMGFIQCWDSDLDGGRHRILGTLFRCPMASFVERFGV